jgi:hypothetical protein
MTKHGTKCRTPQENDFTTVCPLCHQAFDGRTCEYKRRRAIQHLVARHKMSRAEATSLAKSSHAEVMVLRPGGAGVAPPHEVAKILHDAARGGFAIHHLDLINGSGEPLF